MRGKVALAVVAVLVVAAGCGGSGSSKASDTSPTSTTPGAGGTTGPSGSSGSSERPSACKLLTEAEASAAMTVATGPPEENGGGPTNDPPGNTFLCQYHGVATVDVDFIQALTVRGAQGDFAKFKALTIAGATQPGTPVDTSASGDGAEAFANNGNGRIVKGTQEVTVDVQVDINAHKPPGLASTSTADVNAYYNRAVTAILESIRARLTG